MAEVEHWALIKDGVIDNVIVSDEEFATSHAESLDQVTVRVDNLEPAPGIGWHYDGTNFTPPVPPPSLTAVPTQIPPDGTTTSTVTYTNLGDAPAQVTFVINSSVSRVVNVVAGVASIPVASATPNDTVTVTCGDLSVVVAVTA